MFYGHSINSPKKYPSIYPIYKYSSRDFPGLNLSTQSSSPHGALSSANKSSIQ